MPVGIELLPQRGQGLAERIAAAFADAYRTRPLPMLLVGMDTPQLTAATLAVAAHLLAPATDAVLGLAADGGWWAMWLRWPDERLPADVLMSTQATGRVQRDRLVGASLRVHDIPRMHDVDTPVDIVRVAAAAPATRFAAAAASLAPAGDEALLARCCGSALDVGCVPGQPVVSVGSRAHLGLDDAAAVANTAVLRLAASWQGADRWFVTLTR